MKYIFTILLCVLQSCSTQEPKLVVAEDFATHGDEQLLFSANFRKVGENYDITIIVKQGYDNSFVTIRRSRDYEEDFTADFLYPEELLEINSTLVTMRQDNLLTLEEVTDIRDSIQLIEWNRKRLTGI